MHSKREEMTKSKNKMKIEPRYTLEEQEEMHENFDDEIKRNYSEEEQEEMRNFVRSLERRIEGYREAFFDSADFYYEREDNEKVRDREKRGDRKFDYRSAISGLLFKLKLMNLGQRRRIMEEVRNGVVYTIKGIYVRRAKDIPGHLTEPLFLDFASNPLKYSLRLS